MSEQMFNPYILTRSERPASAEIYLPKRIAYQGIIFKSLEKGLEGECVKEYLKDNAKNLLVELKGYPDILNPYQPDEIKRQNSGHVTLKQAKKRIELYRSNFYGWSIYEVNGVFLNKEGGIDEELTQVIRIMFRFESQFQAEAEKMRCGDALRAIHIWFMDFSGNLWEQRPWDSAEKEKFIHHRSPWPEHKLAFVDEYFEAVIKEAAKWLGDCVLFTFGYLIRKFLETVRERGYREDEIWLTSIFNLRLNVIKQLKSSF